MTSNTLAHGRKSQTLRTSTMLLTDRDRVDILNKRKQQMLANKDNHRRTPAMLTLDLSKVEARRSALSPNSYVPEHDFQELYD